MINTSRITNTFTSVVHKPITDYSIGAEYDAAGKEAQEKRSLYHIDDSFRKIVITRNGLHAWQDEKGVETCALCIVSGGQSPRDGPVCGCHCKFMRL